MSLSSNRPKMGFWAVLAFVISSQIATGVFLIPKALGALGSIGLLSWVVTGSGVILLALMFARFCGWYPETGGPHVYVARLFGKKMGFYAAWTYWVLAWFSSAPLLGTIASACCTFLGWPEAPWLVLLIQLLTLLFLVFLNLRGVEASGAIEMGISVLKMIPLLLFPLYALSFIQIDHFTPFNGTDGHWTVALRDGAFITLWAFLGIEAVTAPAGSVNNPQKTIPRALVVGSLIVVFIYFLNTFVLMGVLPKQVLSQTIIPHTAAFQQVFGCMGERIVSFFIMIVCLGAMNAWLLTAGQVAKGAAEQGFFHPIFKKQNAYGAPREGIVISAFLLGLCLLFMADKALNTQILFVIDVSIVASLGIYLVVSWAFLKALFVKKIATVPLVLLGVGASCFCIWAFLSAGLENIGYACLLPIFGIPFQMWWQKEKA